MRIAVLTSSRADYGIYKPLLKALKKDSFFELSVIAFGTHLLAQYGMTVERIKEDGFEVKFNINSMLSADDANAVATATALTSLKFADFWKDHADEFDIVFCLGDRYEMFAAVSAGIPFGVRFAHLHGGETTLGAIDNIYRHAITHASILHFTSADEHAKRVEALLGKDEGVYVCGALSIDNIAEIPLLTVENFERKWSIDLSRPYVLITIHPETVHSERNEQYVEEIRIVLENLVSRYQLIFTMPNADTEGSKWRKLFQDFADNHSRRAFAIENFGTESYFTCMAKCEFMLGNTSSGIIEAASFGRYVINIGDRQKGRVAGKNVLHVPVVAAEVLKAIEQAEQSEVYQGGNPYYKGKAVSIILDVLKNYDRTRSKSY